MNFPEIDEWLNELRRRGWTLYVFGSKDAPELVAHVFYWETCADVALLKGEDDASVYRMPAE